MERGKRVSVGKRIGAVGALGLLALFGCSGGGEPESDYRWEEKTIDEPEPAPAPPPRQSWDDEDDGGYGSERPSRGGAASGSYAGGSAAPSHDAGAQASQRGAIYSPKSGVSCDEEVSACYTAKGGHAGVTEQQFGVDAGKRLARRIDAGPRDARGVYRTDGGFVCDRLSLVCYDKRGASDRVTRAEFGAAAAQALAARRSIERHGPGRRDGRIYSPRENVWCDERVAACYVGDEAHPGYTKQQFGVDAARDLQLRIRAGRGAHDGIYRPGGGFVCDGLSHVCYDRRGASARRTREEFGADAAERLARRVES